MTNCRVNCLKNSVSGFDNDGTAARSCNTSDVPGGRTYTIPFNIPVALSSTVEHIIKPMTSQGAIPYAMTIDSATDRDLSIEKITGADRKNIGILGVQNGPIGTKFPLDGFIDSDILRAGYSALPPDIGLITPERGLTLTVTNIDAAAAHSLKGNLHVWVPAKSGDGSAAENDCPEACAVNAIKNYYEGESSACRFTGNKFKVGLYPLPFEFEVPNGGGTMTLEPALSHAGRVLPIELKLGDLTPATITVDSIEGPGGQPIGLLGDGISDDWDVESFIDWGPIVAHYSNLPPNIDGIYTSQGLVFNMGNSSGAPITIEGILWVYNPPRTQSAAPPSGE